MVIIKYKLGNLLFKHKALLTALKKQYFVHNGRHITNGGVQLSRYLYLIISKYHNNETFIHL